jgi:predicted O-methyltransferase YrrM
MNQFKKNYIFNNIWFDKKNCCDEIYKLKNPKILEVGSYCGVSTCYFIENLYPSHIVCVDTWEGSFEHQNSKYDFISIENNFDYNINLALSDVVNCEFMKIKGSSFNILPSLLAKYKNYFDFIYIDGSHIAPHVLIDAINAFSLLKINGIIAFDDYMWGDTKSLNSPHRAINVFLDIFMDFVKITKKKYQVWVIKIKEPFDTYKL